MRSIIAPGLIAAVGEEPGDRQHVIAVAIDRSVVAAEDQMPGARSARGRPLVAVAAHAKFIENRLNVARVVDDVGNAADRLDLAGRTSHRHDRQGLVGVLGVVRVRSSWQPTQLEVSPG